MNWQVYLAGEIHTNWRSELIDHCERLGLPAHFSCPVTDHNQSDDCGATILGPEDKAFWHDQKSARLNQARNKVFLEKADIVVVRFGEKYRQWNAAFDAGQAVAQGKTLITMHDPSLNHALKEIDSAALVVTQTVEQVVKSLNYICTGQTQMLR